ncbi:hypothetical protein EJB05_42768, partial [Eragrostis curvula]
MAAGMLSRIRLLVVILIGSLKIGAPQNPSLVPSTTDEKHIMIQPQPLVELFDDIIAEILLRLPPEEPFNLVRASLVCETWRRILFDSAFNHRYRKFHGSPPLLGFFHNINLTTTPLFVSTTITALPFSLPVSRPKYSRILDSRHGRVLISGSFGRIIVWNPITNRQKRVPEAAYTSHWEPVTGAVLCARAGCNHLVCNDGPFLVVSLGNNYTDGFMWARVYSSETNTWGTTMTITFPQFVYIEMSSSILVRETLYFIVENGRRIVKCDLARQCLFMTDAPGETSGIVVSTEVGELGFASIEGFDLYLWSLETGVEGRAQWTQPRVIHLKTLLSADVDVSLFSLDVIGFAEAIGTIFISTDFAVFTFELHSQRARRVGKRETYYSIVPYTSFYTPDMLRSNRKMHHENAIDL